MGTQEVPWAPRGSHTPPSLVTRSPYSTGQPTLCWMELPYPSPLLFPGSVTHGQFLCFPSFNARQGISGPVAYGNGSSAQYCPTSWHCSSSSLPRGSFMLLVTDRTSKLPSKLCACWLTRHSEFGGGSVLPPHGTTANVMSLSPGFFIL